MHSANPIRAISREIHACESCPRLRRHCETVARLKRRAFEAQTYHGKPVSGFGAPDARLIIIGLAPGAHGANRTGRVFTGDRSGDWLYRALYRAGFANQSQSRDRGDGLELTDAYITCVVKCAPPQNKPEPGEIQRCSSFLERELSALRNAQVYIALGQISLNGAWPLLAPDLSRPRFAHGSSMPLPNGRRLILSYHPSQQNTFTGRLTEPMFDRIFAEARSLLDTARVIHPAPRAAG